jgi:hypothetical protein
VAARPEAPATAFTVRVEGLSWVNQLLGGGGTGVFGHDFAAAPGDTVRDVLKRASRAHPALDQALWDRGSDALGEHLEVIVNGTVLGVRHTLDSPVHAGDTLLLLGQFQGG